MSRHTHITLQAPVKSFDTALDAVVDGEWVLIQANIAKLIHFFAEDLPQEAQQPFRRQFAVFLEHVCEAGDETNLTREYLGNYLTWGCDSADLPKALSALTRKDLLIRENLEDVAKWVTAVASALNEPYITKLVIAKLLNKMPDDEEEFRRLFLSLI